MCSPRFSPTPICPISTITTQISRKPFPSPPRSRPPNEDPRANRDGVEPRQVHRVSHLFRHLQERLDQPREAWNTPGSTTSRPTPGHRLSPRTGRTRGARTAAVGWNVPGAHSYNPTTNSWRTIACMPTVDGLCRGSGRLRFRRRTVDSRLRGQSPINEQIGSIIQVATRGGQGRSTMLITKGLVQRCLMSVASW